MHTATVEPAIVASAHIPSIITKELKLANSGGRDRVRLSSNFLGMMGFEEGSRHTVEPLAGTYGMVLRTDAKGTQKVYQRRYSSRRNNPLESQIEVSNSSILAKCLPLGAERLHFEMRKGQIIIRPVDNRLFSIRKSLRSMSDPRTAFVALTGGIDVRCFQDAGFSIDSILEYRPQEARDKENDKTETGALNCLFNSAPRVLYNEDIFKVDMDRVRTLSREGAPIGCLSLSLQCDDFSNVKANSLKEKSQREGTSSKNMAYPGLRLVEVVKPATVMIENVPGFATSAQYQMFREILADWGYNVMDSIMGAPHHGDLTLRKRFYMVASVFPGFEFPEPGEMTSDLLWPKILPFLAGCRDISHSKSLTDGLACGRARLITPASTHSPTILKSQMRGAKDSVFIAMPDGTYRFPSNELLQFLNGIPADMPFGRQSKDIESEIIGQSISYGMHHQLCEAIGKHLQAQQQPVSIVRATQQYRPGIQMSLPGLAA
jgi:DNA (cytosine-5)-methyltransferase 1